MIRVITSKRSFTQIAAGHVQLEDNEKVIRITVVTKQDAAKAK